MKVFGLGYHKTATTTLESALDLLGFSVSGKRDDMFDHIVAGDFAPVFAFVETCDAFRDMPWPLIYREVDAKFPGSKFILTYRDPQAWLKSALNHYRDNVRPAFQFVYGEAHGAPLGHEAVWLKKYEQHLAEVREYFRDRPGDFLELDFERGDDWAKLCRFLGKPVPNVPFPHANKGVYTFWEKVWRKLAFTVNREKWKERNRRGF